MRQYRRLSFLAVGVLVFGAATYVCEAMQKHSPAPPITYQGKIERLHQTNHEEREFWHGLRKVSGDNETLTKMHDLLHTGKEALHTLGQAAQGSPDARAAIARLKSLNEEEREVFHTLREIYGETEDIVRLHGLLHEDRSILSRL